MGGTSAGENICAWGSESASDIEKGKRKADPDNPAGNEGPQKNAKHVSILESLGVKGKTLELDKTKLLKSKDDLCIKKDQ